MSPRWRLLGSQEAGCGTLAFRWSTAAIVRRRTERSTEGFATLRERFAAWIAVSNKNGSLGLALTLLYVVRRGLHCARDGQMRPLPGRCGLEYGQEREDAHAVSEWQS